jgi:hypothetical protein
MTTNTPSNNISALMEDVVQASEANNFADARHEWDVGLIYRPATCICGKKGLSHEYTIRNQTTNLTLAPIGSSCIKQFNRPDLDKKARELSKWHKKRFHDPGKKHHDKVYAELRRQDYPYIAFLRKILQESGRLGDLVAYADMVGPLTKREAYSNISTPFGPP